MLRFTVTPELTTDERDAVPAIMRVRGLRIYNITTSRDEKWNGSAWVPVASASGVTSFNGATGAIVLQNGTNSSVASPLAGAFQINVAPSGSLVPQPYQDLADNVIEGILIGSGVMASPPLFVISGQVTGAIQAGVTVELRDNVNNALLQTETTDASGNYTFNGEPAGVYKVVPSIAGHFFTPGSAVITLAADTTQNFVSAVISAGANVSGTHVLVPLNGGTVKMKAVKKSPRGVEANTFASVTATAYTPSYFGSRWFAPNAQPGKVLVFDDAFNLKNTITVPGTVFAVHASGVKLCIITSSVVQFGTYINDVWTAGNQISNEVYPVDSTLGNGKVYIASSYGGTPNRNITIVDISSETIARQSVGTGNLSSITFGNGRLLIGDTSATQQRVVDATTFATIGSLQPLKLGSVRTAYARGKFFSASASNILTVQPENGTAWTQYTFGIIGTGATGCVADADFVYIAESGSGQIRVINAETIAEDGTAATGVPLAAFFQS
jgi:hypothetical protein